MRIAIVNLTSGGMSGGYLKYLHNILPLMQADKRVTGLEVFYPEQVQGLTNNFPIKCHAWPKDNKRWRRWLKTELDKLRPDVLFIPTARWMDFEHIPKVVMVQNMEPLLIPFGGNSLLGIVKNLARAHAARQACCNAQRIIAISQYVRDFIVTRWHIDPRRVGMIYHGVDLPADNSSAVHSGIMNSLSSLKFIFTAGSIRPARGLEDLIGAMKKLVSLHPELCLAIAGKADSDAGFYLCQLRNIAHKSGLAERIVWLGQLDDKEMAWCFKNCEAFVMTSRAEACPNIALEAMSYSCLVVSTIQPPMPEFFGAAALYYAPRHVDDLASQIGAMLALPPARRQEFQHASRTRAADFRWTDTARLTVSELAMAVTGQ